MVFTAKRSQARRIAYLTQKKIHESTRGPLLIVESLGVLISPHMGGNQKEGMAIAVGDLFFGGVSGLTFYPATKAGCQRFG
jgi:hypothetical protein